MTMYNLALLADSHFGILLPLALAILGRLTTLWL